MQATADARPNELLAPLLAASGRAATHVSRALWVASFAPFIAYVKTAAPTVYNLDSAELSTAAATLGIPHPPGYPLYVLAGKAFSLMPLGDIGYRLNLMSAFFAALTLVLVYFIVLHLTGNRLASLAASWTLGFSYHFWADSVVAEVYALDALLLAATVLMLLRWSAGGKTSALCLAFLALGLGLANRTTMLLCLPAVAIYIVLNRRGKGQRWWLSPLASLPGLALYALLPIRAATNASYIWGSSYDLAARPVHLDLTEPSTLWWYVSARIFQPLMQMYDGRELAGQLWTYAEWLWRGFLGIGVVLGLVGIAYLWQRKRRELLLLALIFVPQLLFYANYAAIDKETMFLPTFLVWALAVGAGTCGLLALARSSLARPVFYRALAVSVLIVPFVIAAANARLVDVSEDYRAREQSVALFGLVEPQAIVVGWWTDIAPLEYLQQVEGQRPDVSLVHSWAVNGEFLIDLATANVPGRAMYVMHDEPALRTRFNLVPVGQWYRVDASSGAYAADEGGRP